MSKKLGLLGPTFCLSFGLLSQISGCTFYTACPADNGNPVNPTAGTGSDTGGSGNEGGSSSTAGSSPMGGTSSVFLEGDPPPGDWEDVTPDLGDLKDTCGPFFNFAVYPGRDELITGVFYDMWSTKDGGATWAPLNTGEGGEPLGNRMSQITFDPDEPDRYWEVGTYGNGFFRTDDAGDTFQRVGDLQFLDSVGIDMTDPDRKTMLASVHEQAILQKSVDGGETWDDIYSGMPDDTKHCSYSIVQDADTYLMACGGGSDPGSPKIIRTVDGGDSWKEVHDGGGNTAPLVLADGSIYWSEETGAIAASSDRGKTWERVVAPRLLLQLTPVELPDGRIVSATEKSLVVSDDGGKTWKKASPELPFIPSALAYSAFQKAFFISIFTCYPVPTGSQGGELMRFDFDYEKY
jgi:photosystem II stability/assembly factor-like uncharacterized protein